MIKSSQAKLLQTNGFSLYWTVAFLSFKSADTAIAVLKAYQVEAKQQTG